MKNKGKPHNVMPKNNLFDSDT